MRRRPCEARSTTTSTMLHSWGWDITTTKSTLQCWSAPVFPPRPHPDLLSPASPPAPSPPTSPHPAHLPPTPASSPPPSTSSPTSSSSMHLTAPGEWVWPGAELTAPGLRPPPPPTLPLTPGMGSPPGAFCFPAAAEEDVDDVYRYKQQLRTEQLVQAYMDAVRQSLEQEYSTNNNTSNSNNNSSHNHSLNPHSTNTNCTGTTSDTPAIRYLQQLLPFAYSPGVLHPDVQAAAQDDGKPLDLSATSQQAHKPHSEEREGATSPLSCTKPAVELKVPQILKSGKKKDLNGKKAYTEDELAAAVHDIRSGKLGTRRAAVLYGIPRSTLRNKIFKLESEQNGNGAENGTAPHDNKLSMVDLLQGVPNGDYPPSAGFSLTSDDLSAKHMFPCTEEMWEQKIEQIRRKHNLLQPDRKFGMPPMHLPPGHHLSDCDKSYLGSPFGSDLKLAFLPELVRRMAEERMELERQQSLHSLQQLDLRVPRHGLPHGLPHGLTLNGHHANNTNTNNNNNNNNNNTGVELRVPSYKPMRTTFRNGFMANHHHHHHVNGEEEGERPPSPTHNNSNVSLTPKIGDTLKDIIAKTIAEKMRCRAMLSSNMQQLNINSQLAGHCQPGPLSSDSSSISSNDMGPVEKKPRLSKDGHGKDDKKHSSCSDSNNSSSENKGQRKTRPKRGQYRKYNSQLLLEAVRAVQRGEMSVHRAGSYFGVPHSTLEYKVKERHLLRLKKPREGRSSKKEGAVSPSGTPSSSAPTTSCTTPTPSQSSSRSVTPVCSLSPPLPCPTNSAMSVISSLAHQASSPGLRLHGGSLSSSLSSSLSLGLGAWSSPTNCSSLPLLPSDPGMAAYPAGFALNTSASELLKKLQRKVQAKASLTDSQSTGEMAAALRSAAAMAAAAASSPQTSGNTEAAPVTAQ